MPVPGGSGRGPLCRHGLVGTLCCAVALLHAPPAPPAPLLRLLRPAPQDPMSSVFMNSSSVKESSLAASTCIFCRFSTSISFVCSRRAPVRQQGTAPDTTRDATRRATRHATRLATRAWVAALATRDAARTPCVGGGPLHRPAAQRPRGGTAAHAAVSQRGDTLPAIWRPPAVGRNGDAARGGAGRGGGRGGGIGAGTRGRGAACFLNALSRGSACTKQAKTLVPANAGLVAVSVLDPAALALHRVVLVVH